MNWESWKTVIFYGFMLLCVAWGVVSYSSRYPLQLFLVVLIFALLIMIGIASRQKARVTEQSGL